MDTATHRTTADPASALPRAAIEAFCRRWQIVALELFGSVLRDDFRPDSDFLVTFAPEARWTLLDLTAMHEELAELVGREVDLVERSSVEASPNPIRRQAIIGSTRT
jgi:predicted nucleotidyltransferase